MEAPLCIAHLRFLLRYAKRRWTSLAGSILFALGALLCQLALPWLMHVLIDYVFVSKHGEVLSRTAIELVVCATGIFVFDFARQVTSTYTTGKTLIDIKTDLAKQMQVIPLRHCQQRHSGDVVSLFVSDAEITSRFCRSVVEESFVALITVVLTFCLMLKVNTWTAIAALLAVPPYLIFSLVFGGLIRRVASDYQQCVAESTAKVEESIEASREIRAFGREQYVMARLRASFLSLLRPPVKLVTLRLLSSAGYITFWIFVGIMFWVGGKAVLAHRFEIGVLVALVTYAQLLRDPFSRIVTVYGEFQNIMGASKRIFDFLASYTPEAKRLRTHQLSGCSGDVDFDGVSFSYHSNQQVLANLSFQVRAGEFVGVVGPSGSGKSTLVSLLLRLHEPDQGRILIDGQDLANLTTDSIRSAVAAVFQESLLFAATIRDNISFGDLNATDELIIAAAMAANAHDFIIRELPGGYDTQLGQRGVNLSAGQRQRIAIARALVRNAPILVLDEATSDLDPESEFKVLENLRELRKGRTTILISHKLSTVVSADVIAVLNSGRLTETGTHDALLQRPGLYRHFYEIQHVDGSGQVFPGVGGLPPHGRAAR